MLRLIPRRAFVVLLPLLLLTTSCLPPAFFVQAVRVVGRAALSTVLVEATTDLIERGYAYFFGVVTDKTVDPIQAMIYPLPGKPGYGRINENQEYIIAGRSKSGVDMPANFITVDKKHLEYQRDTYGKWVLTTYSKKYVQERLTVASCQQSLRGMGYAVRDIDGHYGPNTAAAVKHFKTINKAAYGNQPPNGELDHITRRYLIEF